MKEEELKDREVIHMDIAYDEIAEKYYKKEEVIGRYYHKYENKMVYLGVLL